jgi:hypothetical protein
MAAAGGLAMTRSGNHDDSYSQGLVIAFRMITVAIGITVSHLPKSRIFDFFRLFLLSWTSSEVGLKLMP